MFKMRITTNTLKFMHNKAYWVNLLLIVPIIFILFRSQSDGRSLAKSSINQPCHGHQFDIT